MDTKAFLTLLVASLVLVSLSSAFDEVRRDEDYNETGDDYNTGLYRFEGYMNKLEDFSDQASDDELNGEMGIWNNSDGSKDDADQWAITKTLDWSISNRGVPFPPGASVYSGDKDYTIYHSEVNPGDWASTGTYYHRDWSGHLRTSIDSPKVPKRAKAFANSYAAVAKAGFGTDDKGDQVKEGDGVWINPDDIRSEDYRIKGDWQDKVVFNIDITGPDAGLGFHDTDASRGEIVEYNSGGRAVIADIFFEGDTGWNGGTIEKTNENLEPPMCGDDQSEFLLEERGESVNPAEKDGRYACASRRDACVHLDEEPRIIPIGDYKNAGEPDENVGRLKNDREVCEQRPSDSMAAWWDQDWGHIDNDGVQDTCRTNSLYGKLGIRWFDKEYVDTHPHAVTGGIDDDWNAFIENEDYDANHSKPNKNSWNKDESPVPTGSPNKSIGTLGFCGGDDDGEYLVSQRCNSNLCETKRKVQGVASNPDSCVFDGDEDVSKYYAQSNSKSYDVSERGLYQPGDTVTLDPGEDGQELRTLTCFDNKWYRDFPIVFQEESVNVSLGAEERVPFQVINVRDSPRTFEVSLEPGSEIYTYSSFDEKNGDRFETTIPAQSSKQFSVVIAGGDLRADSDLVVKADSVNTEMFGEDSVIVNVVNSTAANGTVLRQEPQSVPGAGPLQLLVLMAMASAVFFIQS